MYCSLEMVCRGNWMTQEAHKYTHTWHKHTHRIHITAQSHSINTVLKILLVFIKPAKQGQKIPVSTYTQTCRSTGLPRHAPVVKPAAPHHGNPFNSPCSDITFAVAPFHMAECTQWSIYYFTCNKRNHIHALYISINLY